MQRINRAAKALGINFDIFSSRSLRIVISSVFVSGLFLADLSQAASLSSASVSLTDPRTAQASVGYNFTASSFSGGTVKCVKEVFSTTPSGSTKPTGMVTASGITINASQTLLASTAGWTRGGADTDGTVTFTNAASVEAPSGTKAWNLTGFTNSSVANTSFWLKINTYGNADCTTSPVDSTIVGFVLDAGSQLSFTVDPSLSFTVSAVATAQACDGTTTTATTTPSTIPFGTVSSAANGVACQDLTASSNGTTGYSVYIRYSGQLSNGVGGLINNHTGTNAAPTVFSAAGTSSYGYATNDATLGTGTANRFTNGGQKWAAATTSNAELAFEAAGVTAQTYRIGHQAGISTVTGAGVYTTTIIYTCTPVY